MALTERDRKLIAILPLVGAFISVLFCIKLIVTVVRNAYFRSRVYQRLMAACAFNVIIQSFSVIWGPFAVPAGTRGFPYASGTVATCSARGFLGMLITVVPNYFLAIYVLAFLGVKTKFNAQKNQWIEKWIHLIVYALPIGRGAYLLTVDAFNPIVRTCSIASIPLGCGDKYAGTPDYQPCTRGPENISELQWYFIALPSALTMILPTLMMLVMYCRLRHQAVVASVLKQSALFFFVGIYFTFFFTATDYAIVFRKEAVFPATNILANVIRSLQGVWVYLVYRYFRSEEPLQQQSPQDASEEKPGRPEDPPTVRTGCFDIFRTAAPIRPEFSIFDGTSVASSSSPWAKYLVDEGEDASYQDGYEYEDTDYDYGLGDSNIGVEPKQETTDHTLEAASDDFAVNPR